MASWRALYFLVVVAFWGVIGCAMALMVTPVAGSDWWSYAVALGALALYAWTCLTFVRERRRRRWWT